MNEPNDLVQKAKSSKRRWVEASGKILLFVFSAIAFFAGVAWSISARAEEPSGKKAPRIVYPKKTELDFEGAAIDGELRNPGDFYFQHRPEEKFDSLVKRRKNFHREMLRDAVLGK